MGKLKRFLASLMVGVTLCTLTAPSAFAAETASTSINSGKVLEIEKTFQSKDGSELPSETFQFTMKPDETASGISTDGNNLNIYEGVSLGDNDTIEMSFDSKTTTTQQAGFDLSNLTFTNTPGIYKYIVKEVVPTDANENIKYDSSEYSVSVYVNKSGEIVAIVSYNVKGNKTPIQFKNTYKQPKVKYDQLVVKKKVEGSMGDKTQKFTFYLNLELASGTKVKGTIARSDNTTETMTFKTGNNKFQLADGDVLTVTDLPEGTLYTVTETGASGYTTDIVCTTKDSDGKDKKVEVNYSKKYTASKYQTPIVTGGTTVEFTNTKDYVVPTGVRLDIMPYLTLLAFALVGSIIFFSGRRRKR
jgi:pilin isopeptide linkage protein